MMKKRIQKLPDSELDVMIALWNGHQEMTRSEIEDFMNQKKKLAPTTILTLLSRLEKKNFVSVKKEGKANLYSALVTQEEYQQQEGKHVLEKLYDNSLCSPDKADSVPPPHPPPSGAPSPQGEGAFLKLPLGGKLSSEARLMRGRSAVLSDQ